MDSDGSGSEYSDPGAPDDDQSVLSTQILGRVRAARSVIASTIRPSRRKSNEPGSASGKRSKVNDASTDCTGAADENASDSGLSMQGLAPGCWWPTMLSLSST